MPLSKCAACQRLPVGQMVTVYWGWYDATGQRQARRAKYCSPCARDRGLKEEQSLTVKDGYYQVPSSCLKCEDPLPPDTLAVVYATVYEGRDRADVAIGWCEGCTAQLCADVVLHGDELEDRLAGPSKPGRGGGPAKKR